MASERCSNEINFLDNSLIRHVAELLDCNIPARDDYIDLQ